MEHLEKFKQNLKEEIKRHPRYPDMANMLGLLLSVQGRHDEALEEYERALGINPGYAQCRANRAFALAAAGKTREAVEAAEALSSEAPGNYDVLAACGKLLGAHGDAASALATLEKAAALKPACPAIYHYLGLLHLPDNSDKASELFEKAVGLGTAYIALYDSLHIYKKGRIMLAGAGRQVTESLSKQLGENPNIVKVHIGVAKMLASEGLFDEASARFDKARAVEPDSPEIENGLGLVAVAREYGEEAKLHFRRALQFDPANISALVNLAFQLGAEGNLSDAEKEMRKAVELAPRYPDLRVQLATILTEREDLEEAISHLREALSINPGYVFAAFILGSILFTKKRYQEVINTYAQMDVDAMELPEVYSQLATSHLETGQTEKALDIAKKAVSPELEKDALPSTYVCLAIAYYRLEKTEEAAASAGDYVRRFPNGPEIEEIQKLLELLKNTPGKQRP